MNVLILTPDRVGSTLLQRLLTINIQKELGAWHARPKLTA